MNLEVMVAIFTAAIVPLLTGVAVKYSWSANVKAGVATLLSIVGGVAVYAYTPGFANFSWSNAIALLVGIVAVSEALYSRVFQPMGLTDYLQKFVGNTD